MLNIQNNPQLLTLAKYNTNNNQITLQQPGIKLFNNFNRGQINIICIEDFTNRKYDILGNQNRGSYKNKPDNCLLVRSNPIFDTRMKKYIFVVELQASNQVARENLHVLAAIISNIVIIPLLAQDNPIFLTAVNKKIGNMPISKLKNDMMLSKVGSLLFVLANPSEKGEFMVDSTEKLLSKLEMNGLLAEVVTAYPTIKGLQCPQACLYDSTQNFKQTLLHEIQLLSTNPKQNQQLMYGPIFTNYLQNIITQLNKNQQLNLQAAQDQIIIDQGYQAYKAGIQKYHQMGLRLIDKNNKPDNNQLEKMMEVARIKAFDQFYMYKGSNQIQYRKMLEDYIGNKNKEVIGYYSEELRNKNLQILQSQSKNVLDQISASRVKDPIVINQYISQMTKNYQQYAKGPQKHEILNDYMKVFTPIAFEGDPQKQARLRQQMRKNQQLQQRLNQLKKKKGGCCSSCSIM